MALRPLKKLPLPDLPVAIYRDWLAEIEDRLAQPDCDRYRLTRDVLFELYFPGLTDYDEVINDSATPGGTKAVLAALDPHAITLEPEYYNEIDVERYATIKPLLWLWQGFDRSPMGGGNIDVGVRLRRLLAPLIFKKCGENFKCFQFVEFSFGYNMEVGDNVVVHRHVLLDDRGGIVLGNGVSIADYANIYSHTHDIVDQRDVDLPPTRLDDGVRITYHATVLGGTHVGVNGMVGAMALTTRDVLPYHVNLGIPARPVKIKPNAPAQYVEGSPIKNR